ncbi:MAG: helix-turn-helix domain-containing protein [Dysgonomonas sp.]
MTDKLSLMPYSQDEMRAIIKGVVCEALQEFESLRAVQKEVADSPMTRKEAMAFLRVKSTKLNQLRRDGLITPIRPDGKKTLYLKEDLINFLKKFKATGGAWS